MESMLWYSRHSDEPMVGEALLWDKAEGWLQELLTQDTQFVYFVGVPQEV
jgi:hypothetical protein